MASWEETVRPNFDVAVSHVTELIRDANILDKLLAENVLTFSQYDDMLRSAKSDPKHAARLLLTSLKLSTTKLDTFLAILPDVEGGKELHSALTTSNVLSEEKETASRTAKEAIQPSLASMIAKKVLHELAPHQSDVSSDIGQMADPKWKQILSPVQSDAVTLAADLLSPTSLFLDKLAEKECLTDSLTEIIRRLRREHGPIEAARELFDKLKKQPSPSFDTFCMILLDVTSRDARQGKDLYNLLVKPSQLDSSVTSVAAERQEEPNGAAACSEAMPDSKISESNPQHCSKNELSLVEQVPCNTQKGEEVVQPLNPDTERHLSSKDEQALSDKVNDSSEMLRGTKEPPQLVSSMTSGAAGRQEEPNDAAAVQSRPKDVSDKAAISKIASSVSSTFIPAAKKDSSVLVSLGNLSQQILEVMQQSVDSKFTVAQVTLITRNWKWSERQRKGLAVLECLTEANEEVKASFAFALFAVDASVLAKVSPDVYEKVSRSSVKEYLKVGVAWIGNDAFRNSLQKNLGSVAGKRKEFKIVLLGKAGVGKSTLIDCLVGRSPVRQSKTEESQACTPFAGAYHVICSQDVPIDPVIWNTPGLFDTYLNENEYTTQTRNSEYLKEIAKQVKEVDLVIFCADATNPCHSSEVSRIMSSVTNAFSKEIWQHSMFVFTKANLVRAREDDVDEDDAHLQKMIAELTDGYRNLLLRCEINQEVIDFIPFVPVGSARDRILANGKPWIPEFWVTAVERATDAGCRFPLMFNEKQLQFAENQLQSEEHVKRSMRSNASGGTIVTKVFNWFKRGP